MNFPIGTAQRILQDLRQPVERLYDVNHSYQRAVDDLINILFQMDKDITDLKSRIESLEQTTHI